jgi:hypothetical protein
MSHCMTGLCIKTIIIIMIIIIAIIMMIMMIKSHFIGTKD